MSRHITVIANAATKTNDQQCNTCGKIIHCPIPIDCPVLTYSGKTMHFCCLEHLGDFMGLHGKNFARYATAKAGDKK
jgi:hypothetical protein